MDSDGTVGGTGSGGDDGADSDDGSGGTDSGGDDGAGSDDGSGGTGSDGATDDSASGAMIGASCSGVGKVGSDADVGPVISAAGDSSVGADAPCSPSGMLSKSTTSMVTVIRPSRYFATSVRSSIPYSWNSSWSGASMAKEINPPSCRKPK